MLIQTLQSAAIALAIVHSALAKPIITSLHNVRDTVACSNGQTSSTVEGCISDSVAQSAGLVQIHRHLLKLTNNFVSSIQASKAVDQPGPASHSVEKTNSSSNANGTLPSNGVRPPKSSFENFNQSFGRFRRSKRDAQGDPKTQADTSKQANPKDHGDKSDFENLQDEYGVFRKKDAQAHGESKAQPEKAAANRTVQPFSATGYSYFANLPENYAQFRKSKRDAQRDSKTQVETSKQVDLKGQVESVDKSDFENLQDVYGVFRKRDAQAQGESKTQADTSKQVDLKGQIDNVDKSDFENLDFGIYRRADLKQDGREGN